MTAWSDAIKQFSETTELVSFVIGDDLAVFMCRFTDEVDVKKITYPEKFCHNDRTYTYDYKCNMNRCTLTGYEYLNLSLFVYLCDQHDVITDNMKFAANRAQQLRNLCYHETQKYMEVRKQECEQNQ